MRIIARGDWAPLPSAKRKGHHQVYKKDRVFISFFFVFLLFFFLVFLSNMLHCWHKYQSITVDVSSGGRCSNNNNPAAPRRKHRPWAAVDTNPNWIFNVSKRRCGSRTEGRQKRTDTRKTRKLTVQTKPEQSGPSQEAILEKKRKETEAETQREKSIVSKCQQVDQTAAIRSCPMKKKCKITRCQRRSNACYTCEY